MSLELEQNESSQEVRNDVVDLCLRRAELSSPERVIEHETGRGFKYRYCSNSIVAIYPLIRDNFPNFYSHVSFYGCFDGGIISGNSHESSNLVSDLKAIDYSTVRFYGWERPRRYSIYRATSNSSDPLEARMANRREEKGLIDLLQAERIIAQYE